MTEKVTDFSKRPFAFYRATAIDARRMALVAGLLDEEGNREELNPFYEFDIDEGWKLTTAFGDTFPAVTFHTKDGAWATSRQAVSVPFDRVYEPVDNFPDGPFPLVLNDFKVIENRYFACGAGGLFASADKLGAMKSQFDRFSQVPDISSGSIRENVSRLMGWAEDTVLDHFNSLAGLKKDDIYAVCDEGIIYRFTSEGYERREVASTDFLLVYVTENGRVYISNNDPDALILSGDLESGFQTAFASDKHGLARSFCEYEGALYVSFVTHGRAARPLFILEDDGVKEVPEVAEIYANENMGTIFHIQKSGDVLWLACDRGVLWFDGETWNNAIHPLARSVLS